MTDKFAVIGAGPMGLAVAYELVRNGYCPVIFEADDRIGGMTASFNFGSLSIERYYHFHCISDKDFLTVLDELNLTHKMKWTETKMGFFYKNKIHSWGNPIALLKFPGLSLISKVRYGLHAFLSTKRNDWSSLDSVDAISWIKRWVGKEAYSVLWEKLFTYKFYDFSHNLSAAWIWSRVRRIGRSRYNLFKEKLGYLEGGSETLLTGMRKYIENNGGVLRLAATVDKVVIENRTVKGVVVNGVVHEFDKVISTIPLPFVSRMIPDLPDTILQQYNNLKNIAVVCVIAKLKKQVTENFWLNVNDESMDIPGVIEYTNLRPLENTIVYVPFYMPHHIDKFKDSDDSFKLKVKEYLKRINTDLQDLDFLDMHVSRYRYAQPICPPDFLKALPPFDLPISGLLAADTSYYYPEDRGISESIGFGRMMAKKACA